jgi:transposase
LKAGGVEPPSNKEKTRMKLHGNAALSLNQRRRLARRVVEEDWSLTSAAAAAEVSGPTARKWAGRYREEGEAGLLDRPSAARRVHNRTPEERIGAICALRRLRMTAAEIAEALGMPETTVSGILTRTGLGRLGRLGLEPARRYERSRPGELIHIDVKKLGRIGPNGAGHRVTAGGSPTAAAPMPRAGSAVTSAGSSSTSASTTRPAWPTSRSWATRRAGPRWASCAGPSASSIVTA